MTRLFLALLLGAAALPALAIDESDLLPIEEAFALSASAPSADRVEFRWTIADGYYLYRHRTRVQAEDGFAIAGEPALPDGVRHVDEFFGEVETYRGTLVATVAGTPAAGARSARFRVSYQGCADIGICYPPHTETVEVALPAAPAAAVDGRAALDAVFGRAAGGPLAGLDGDAADLPMAPERAFRFEAIAGGADTLLLRFTPAPGYYLYRDRAAFRLIDAEGLALGAPAWPEGSAHRDEYFGDVVVYFDEVEVALPLAREIGPARTVRLEATFQGCQTDGICYPPMTRTVEVALPAADSASVAGAADGGPARETPPPARAAMPWWAALLFALGGGLILNLMPCVLPVLSLKAISLAQSGQGRGAARARALWYTAGVLVAFAALGAVALALREAGLALGWGFQLQQPLVVAALAYVMFALGLSLSGVFSVGTRLAGVGDALTRRTGPAGDFFTGVLAVVVASPCTAPFMGAALTFAFAAPPALAMLVFLALGLGLALPFLLIAFVPALAAHLPRPGPWMETLKQVMAFPLYATAAWLAWVLTSQRGADATAWLLAGALLLAFGLWLAERLRHRERPVLRTAALLIALAAAWPLWRVHGLPAPERGLAQPTRADGAIPYSASALEALRRDGRTVFVNMTADWCMTCKANERRVLDTAAFRAALARAGAVYMVGDWTNVDPEITAFLEAHGAVGVPLYVVLHPEHGDRVLPTVLTQSQVEAALAGGAP